MCLGLPNLFDVGLFSCDWQWQSNWQVQEVHELILQVPILFTKWPVTAQCNRAMRQECISHKTQPLNKISMVCTQKTEVMQKLDHKVGYTQKDLSILKGTWAEDIVKNFPLCKVLNFKKSGPFTNLESWMAWHISTLSHQGDKESKNH